MGGIIVTDQNWRNGGMPRLSTEHPDIFIGSPLAVIGLWVFALRQRFAPSQDASLPWAWYDSIQPSETEDGNPLPDGSPRKLLIESAYNVEKSERNYRPAIYVGRFGGQMTANKVSVNNFVGKNLPNNFQAYHCQGTMPVIFECESETSAESSLIAETSWAFVLSTRDIFRQDFGLYDITEPVLGDTEPDKSDKEVWVTRVQFTVTCDFRWGTIPVASKLRDIAMTIIKRNNPDYFVKLAGVDGTED